jgi:hypothetical protein
MPIDEVHNHSAPEGRQKCVNGEKLPVKESSHGEKPIFGRTINSASACVSKGSLEVKE